jgi:hypothetical protein
MKVKKGFAAGSTPQIRRLITTRLVERNSLAPVLGFFGVSSSYPGRWILALFCGCMVFVSSSFHLFRHPITVVINICRQLDVVRRSFRKSLHRHDAFHIDADIYLSSTIIQDVLQHCHENVESSVAYFYFDFNDPAKRQPDKLVRSLVTQLSMQNPEGMRELEQLYLNCQHGQRQPAGDALVVILGQLLAGRDHVYVVLDALDECQSQDELMGLIQTITERHLGSLHLLVTSRKERDIEDALELLVTGEVCIESAVVDADIQIHIRERLQRDPKLRKWPSPVQLEIEQALMQSAHGMLVTRPACFRSKH